VVAPAARRTAIHVDNATHHANSATSVCAMNVGVNNDDDSHGDFVFFMEGGWKNRQQWEDDV